MSSRRFTLSLKAFISLAVVVIILSVFMPRRGEFEYHYSKGGKWNYETLVASFDFPILKTDAQLIADRELLESIYVPYFQYHDELLHNIGSKVEHKLAGNEHLSKALITSVSPYIAKGILPDRTSDYDYFRNNSLDVVFVQRGKHAVKTPVAELSTVEQVRSAVRSALLGTFPDQDVDSILYATSVLDLVVPNLEFDRQTTDFVHQESSDYISPTCGSFNAGDIVVSNGEIITADIAQILDSYKAEYMSTQGYGAPIYALWGGNILMSIILVAVLVLLLWFCRPSIFESMNELLFILTVYLVCAIVTIVFAGFDVEYSFLIPYPVFALYYMAFFRRRFVLPLYMVTLLPLLIISSAGTTLYSIFLVGGIAAVAAFSRLGNGWRQFVSMLIISLSMILVHVSFSLISGVLHHEWYYELFDLFLSSLFCILAYPLVYLFEIIFNLISISRLVDLADTNNPLLRTLAQKAPGTFQHSLAVMNMVDAAGRSVDADIPLLRAAALYHDIGKTENPMCFVENQNGSSDYHAGLTPQESAADIIRHVTDGLALAEKHRVPELIRSFISTHHGSSTASYFYTQYVNNGGDPDAVADFTYPGPSPSTKEQVILMICDSVEAASRTLKDFSRESVEKLVHGIYSAKYHAGQFDDADISMRDIKKVEAELVDYLLQTHHNRIAYPKRKNKK